MRWLSQQGHISRHQLFFPKRVNCLKDQSNWKADINHTGFSGINGNCLLLRLLSGLASEKETGHPVPNTNTQYILTSPSRKKALRGVGSSRTSVAAQLCQSQAKNDPNSLSFLPTPPNTHTSLASLPFSSPFLLSHFKEKSRNHRHTWTLT